MAERRRRARVVAVLSSVVLGLGAGLLSGCGSDVARGASAQSTSASATATASRDPNVVELRGRTASLQVGQRLHIGGYDTMTAKFVSATSSNPTRLTKLSDRTFAATSAGSVRLRIKTTYHECATSCGHPNAAIDVRVTIVG